MRTLMTTLAAIATSAALLATLAPAGAATKADEREKLTASATSVCREDGTTRVRVRVKNDSEKLIRTVAYSWQKTGRDQRLATTSVDAPEAKRVLAITIPDGGSVKIAVTADSSTGETLFKRTFKPLDC